MFKSDYENFDLEFTKIDRGHIVSARTFTGETKQTIQLPIDFNDVQRFTERFEQSLFRRMGDGYIKDFGEILYETIFQEDIRALFKGSLDVIESSGGKRLRIRLKLDEDAILHCIPWEFFYQRTTNQFLSRDLSIPIVRYIGLPRIIPQFEVEPPLRILGFISNPLELAQLDTEHEKAKIQEGLKDLEEGNLVIFDWIKAATVPELQKALRKNVYHVFHFIGHSGFNTNSNDSWIAFEDDQKRLVNVNAEQLSSILSNHGFFNLVVLNSCSGATTSVLNPFAGTANTLVQHGMPAVVAMQFIISDSASISFSSEFYAAMADGYPVEDAVTNARVGIFSGLGLSEWGTPVLFMRSNESHLFALNQEYTPEEEDIPVPNPSPPERNLRYLLYSVLVLIPGILTIIFFMFISDHPKKIGLDILARQIKFSLVHENSNDNRTSILYTGIRSSSINTGNFNATELILDKIHSGQNTIEFKNPVTIVPEDEFARLIFRASENLMLYDVLCYNGSEITIAKEEAHFSLSIENSDFTPYLELSLGEEVEIVVQGGQVFDDSNTNLTHIFTEGVWVRLHSMSRALRISGNTGKIHSIIRTANETSNVEIADPVKFILELPIQELDFSTDVYRPTGKIRRSTIERISVKRQASSEDLVLTSQDEGDLEMTAIPNRFMIYNLEEDGEYLNVRAANRLTNLEIRQSVRKIEIIPVYLSIAARYPVESVVIAWLIYLAIIFSAVVIVRKMQSKTV